ncbi:flagellar export protein FliJ [Actinotalea sp. K2]|uniref:flagellar export protein FliJ n=1 Tax=Actinotalea sp. K2 TaxID=2939438 RepID=UPI002017F415|nr:flagellar export protein FliJ [Actinotalea sp. K2]MCL3860860.1 flagellar export protein FliJ [Actinotalea sp. K2]
MTPPLFRLGGLLRLRKMQEDEAAAEVARAYATHKDAADRRQQTAELLHGAALPLRGDDLTWQAAIAGRAALRTMLHDSLTAVEVAQTRVDQASAHWADARTRAATLGKLEERHDQEVRVEADRAEQVVLDEAASRRHHQADTELADVDPTEGDS